VNTMMHTPGRLPVDNVLMTRGASVRMSVDGWCARGPDALPGSGSRCGRGSTAGVAGTFFSRTPFPGDDSSVSGAGTTVCDMDTMKGGEAQNHAVRSAADVLTAIEDGTIVIRRSARRRKTISLKREGDRW